MSMSDPPRNCRNQNEEAGACTEAQIEGSLGTWQVWDLNMVSCP